MAKWTRPDNFSVIKHQQLYEMAEQGANLVAGEGIEILNHTRGRAITANDRNRRQYSFYGEIVDTGPGPAFAEDFTDERYWVKRLTCKPKEDAEEGPTDRIKLVATHLTSNYTTIVCATNIPEIVSGTHYLAIGDIVRVEAIEKITSTGKTTTFVIDDRPRWDWTRLVNLQVTAGTATNANPVGYAYDVFDMTTNEQLAAGVSPMVRFFTGNIPDPAEYGLGIISITDDTLLLFLAFEVPGKIQCATPPP